MYTDSHTCPQVAQCSAADPQLLDRVFASVSAAAAHSDPVLREARRRNHCLTAGGPRSLLCSVI